MAQGENEQAERDGHAALALAADTGAFLHVPEALEVLGGRPSDEDNHRHAARLFGAAAAIRAAMGVVRLPVYSIGYDAAVTATREALGQKDFDAAWAEGAALSTDEAIAYAQRGRGERKRPASGWESLTPTENDVVRLVAEGLGQQGHRRADVHLAAHRADPPHARLRQIGPGFADATGSGGRPSRRR